MSKLGREYRERSYIIKDIIWRLIEHGELNQTKLFSYCGLSLARHKDIIESMERKGLLTRIEEQWGSKKIVKYRATEKAREFCRMILEPYEEMFPRKKDSDGEQS